MAFSSDSSTNRRAQHRNFLTREKHSPGTRNPRGAQVRDGAALWCALAAMSELSTRWRALRTWVRQSGCQRELTPVSSGSCVSKSNPRQQGALRAPKTRGIAAPYQELPVGVSFGASRALGLTSLLHLWCAAGAQRADEFPGYSTQVVCAACSSDREP